MGNPYVGEIRVFAGNFAPAGWALCDGQLLPIAENDVLFTLIGTYYGGDGQSTFALPDLRGRAPVHMGSNYVLAEQAGSETVTLTSNEMPSHTHAPAANADAATASSPAGNLWAASNNYNHFAPAPGSVAMNPGAIGAAGGSQPHDNMLPYLAVNFIISLFGLFPTPG